MRLPLSAWLQAAACGMGGIRVPIPRYTRRMARTTKLPYDPVAAVKALAAADPKLGRVIAAAGPFTVRLPQQQSPFEALLRSIIYQQIHGKAALAIHTRLLQSFSPHLPPNAPLELFLHPTPEQVLDAPNESLRAAGLSANKALALRDLAAKTLDGTVPTLVRIRRMPDQDIIDQLTQVRGIGEWTVEMMLIFRLGRPNILPTSDFGVRKGFAHTYLGLKPATKVTPALLATAAQIERRAKKWQPWCSVASWYMWRACDLAAGKTVQPE
jgi:DNA-3-methyladenine glycosylase II